MFEPVSFLFGLSVGVALTLAMIIVLALNNTWR